MKTRDENEEIYATVSHESWDLWRVLMWIASV